MLSQWFEIITTCITLACLCRCPCYRSPESNSIFRNERRNRHVCRCCIINRQRLRKILRFHRHYYSLPETTNAANYATTRAANRTSTTRLLLTIIYYFFPPSPVLKRVTNNRYFHYRSCFIRKEKGMQRFNVSVEADLSVRGN